MGLYVTSEEFLFSKVSSPVTWPGNVYEILLGPIND